MKERDRSQDDEFDEESWIHHAESYLERTSCRKLSPGDPPNIVEALLHLLKKRIKESSDGR